MESLVNLLYSTAQQYSEGSRTRAGSKISRRRGGNEARRQPRHCTRRRSAARAELPRSRDAAGTSPTAFDRPLFSSPITVPLSTRRASSARLRVVTHLYTLDPAATATATAAATSPLPPPDVPHDVSLRRPANAGRMLAIAVTILRRLPSYPHLHLPRVPCACAVYARPPQLPRAQGCFAA